MTKISEQQRLLEPSKATLTKYGLSSGNFWFIAKRQNYVCAVCRCLPKTGRLCIDHEHIRGWSKLEPGERRRYVRGLLCWNCNYRFLARGMTVDRAKNVVDYLEAYTVSLSS